MASNILICGTNWLGDSVMSMPAIQMLKNYQPECRITILAKSRLASLWAMHASVDEVIEYQSNAVRTIQISKEIRRHKFDRAYIFPNSFRSALIPFLGCVPVRIGLPGHQRAWLLTDVVKPSADQDRMHQSREYFKIMGLKNDNKDFDVPRLSVPEALMKEAGVKIEAISCKKLTGIFPGAARGPAKRWPLEYFIETGRKLVSTEKCGILVFGTEKEIDLCGKVVEGIGDKALNLSGSTSLQELAALLELCSVVITNDSGGMHLAAAVGAKVVAVFGLTDPCKTSPLGMGHKIITADNVSPSRDIERDSETARKILQSIKPEAVFEAASELLADEK
ncbi:lipopolysaccharide heptosyltransferase II [Verrucomicrobiota bacterium]